MNWGDIVGAVGLLALGFALHRIGRSRDRRMEIDRLIERDRHGEGRA